MRVPVVVRSRKFELFAAQRTRELTRLPFRKPECSRVSHVLHSNRSVLKTLLAVSPSAVFALTKSTRTSKSTRTKRGKARICSIRGKARKISQERLCLKNRFRMSRVCNSTTRNTMEARTPRICSERFAYSQSVAKSRYTMAISPDCR